MKVIRRAVAVVEVVVVLAHRGSVARHQHRVATLLGGGGTIKVIRRAVAVVE